MTSFNYNGHVIAEGSVITGTLRTSDLLCSFREEIARYVAVPSRQVSSYFEAGSWLEGRTQYAVDEFMNSDENEDEYEEAGSRLVEELREYLDGMTPEGWYFGANPGDGADFGWWRCEEEEA